MNSADADVTPLDLLELATVPFLGDVLREVDRQWPQGRDPRGNGHGSRIGTVEAYFDHADVLHMHFRERGAYVRREGVLEKVPVGHLSSYDVNPVFNMTDTLAQTAGELLVSLPKGVDPNDPRWSDISGLLAQMQADAE